MTSKSEILTIDLATAAPGPSEAPENSQLIMSQLRANGLYELDIRGLSRYLSRLRDGEVWDLVALRVDDDAMFLIEAYQALQRALGAKNQWSHRVYLNDGCFEIHAHYLPPSSVRLRMGEYRDNEFDPDSTEGVTLPLSEYVALWNTIAGTITRASRSPDSGSERAPSRRD